MRTLVLLFIVLSGPLAHGFINIEALRRSQKEGLTGSVNLQASGQTGNTNKFVTDLSALNMFRAQDREYLFMANYKYGESNDIRDVNQGSLHLRYAQGWNWFPMTEAYIQSQFDQFKLLKVRNLIGTGLRFHLMEGPKGGSFLGVGFFKEWEEIDLPNEDQEDWRGNMYLSHVTTFAENWSGTVTLYFQPAFDNASDYRLRGEFGVESKITERLSLTITYSHQYDTEPPPTVKKHDISYLAGISLKY